MDLGITALVIVIFLIGPAIGAWIGHTKGRTLLGGVFGLFGVLGWLVIALWPSRPNPRSAHA